MSCLKLKTLPRPTAWVIATMNAWVTASPYDSKSQGDHVKRQSHPAEKSPSNTTALSLICISQVFGMCRHPYSRMSHDIIYEPFPLTVIW